MLFFFSSRREVFFPKVEISTHLTPGQARRAGARGTVDLFALVSPRFRSGRRGVWARRRRGSADSRAAARRARRTAGSPPCAGRACRRERINTAIHIYRHAACASGRCAMCGQPARCGLSLRSLRVPFSLRPVASRSFRSAPFRSARSVPLAPFPVASAASAARGGVGPPSAPVFPCPLPTPRSVCSRLCSPLLRSARSQLATARSPIARSRCPLAIACSPSIARHRCPVRRCPVANGNAQ